MQQRQLRLGDVLDDYCPRERRLTNHVIVAMIDADVKQTRCATCEAEHEYKHARVPRQRRKPDVAPALSASGAVTPKRLPSAVAPALDEGDRLDRSSPEMPLEELAAAAEREAASTDDEPDVLDGDAQRDADAAEDGPVHRPLIRATLPRPEGQPPPMRPGPEFTIRQPGGRINRFRPRHQRSEQSFQGNRSNGSGGGPMRSGARQNSGRPPLTRLSDRRGPGRRRSK